MRAVQKAGTQAWPSPDVMEFMGAKDALTKVAHMKCGLEDTLAYYSPEEFSAGFKKTMKFQPRVIKQNLWASLGIVAVLIPATIFGLGIGPAVLIHEGSTLIVVANALRLLALPMPSMTPAAAPRAGAHAGISP